MSAFASYVDESSDGCSFDVYSAHHSGPSFTIEKLHISCNSDPYSGPKHKYGGIIIYARNGETDWYTANNTHCKSGYVVIMRTDTEEFKKKQNKWRERERGAVHGTIYRIAFGESCDDATVIGEGFGIIDGEFKIKSGAFNPAHDDDYHDDTVYMHPRSAEHVETLVDIWQRAAPHFPQKKNYSVKELAVSRLVKLMDSRRSTLRY